MIEIARGILYGKPDTHQIGQWNIASPQLTVKNQFGHTVATITAKELALIGNMRGNMLAHRLHGHAAHLGEKLLALLHVHEAACDDLGVAQQLMVYYR